MVTEFSHIKYAATQIILDSKREYSYYDDDYKSRTFILKCPNLPSIFNILECLEEAIRIFNAHVEFRIMPAIDTTSEKNNLLSVKIIVKQ